MTSHASSKTRTRGPENPRALLLAWTGGDPQGLDAFVHSWKIREGVLIDHERLTGHTLSRIALWVSTGDLTVISDETIRNLLATISEELLEEDLVRWRGSPPEHAGADEYLCRELAMPPEHCLGARVRFNALPRPTREAFFALLHPEALRLTPQKPPLPERPAKLDGGDPASFALALDAFKALFDMEDPMP